MEQYTLFFSLFLLRTISYKQCVARTRGGKSTSRGGGTAASVTAPRRSARLAGGNLLLFFITNTKEFASFCLCVLYSGRSTVHAETPFSRICDK